MGHVCSKKCSEPVPVPSNQSERRRASMEHFLEDQKLSCVTQSDT